MPAAIEDSAAAGRRAVVHCWGGVGRTGTVVGCPLRQHFGLSGDEALARIAEEWKGVEKNHRMPRSAKQAAFVRAFEPVPAAAGKQLGKHCPSNEGGIGGLYFARIPPSSE